MYDNADYNSAIKKNPTNTSKIDGFVLLLNSVKKTKDMQKKDKQSKKSEKRRLHFLQSKWSIFAATSEAW